MAKAAPAVRPLLRRLHIYLSFFVAPCLIFFAVTGAFQTFRIPDQKTAPVLLQKLARVHRDSVFAVKPPPRAVDDHAQKQAARPKPKPSFSVQATRWLFVVVSILIVVTTLMGLWMGLAYSRDRMVLWLLLLAGAVVPAVVLAL